MHEHDHGTGWFLWASSALLVLLIINAYVIKLLAARKTRKIDKEKALHMEKNIKAYKVEGMTCDHCKATVEKGLMDLQGVSQVMADRKMGQVLIEAESVSENKIKEIVEKLGYSYGGKL